jgi:3-deoxy-D-manno-octulosonic-acid transferase
MYFLYSALTAIAMVLLAPYFVLQGLRRGKYIGNFRERMGYLPESLARNLTNGGTIWVHAVSVGEVLASKPVVDGLRQRFPERPIFVSTTTATGQQLARDRIRSANGIFYFPFDWRAPVRRAFGTIRPALVVILETEIWPNFMREAERAGVPVVFVNSRISDRSIRRFRRFRRLIEPLFRRALAHAEMILTQSGEDAKRLEEMGASEERIEVTGNLKYDIEPPGLSPFGEWLAKQVATQERWPVFVAGSVVEGEEEAVLAAYDIVQRQWRHALLVLAPRKPQRFDAAEALVKEGGWIAVRRSRIDLSAALDENCDVVILDSIGELAGIYSFGDAVFVGGSLVNSGGHNILEPAWFEKPPVFGHSMENFRDIAAKFSSTGAGIQVSSGQQLGKAWAELVTDSAKRERMGQKARALVESNRGATARSLKRIVAVLDQQRGNA